jgi:Fe-S-cluster containining protein
MVGMRSEPISESKFFTCAQCGVCCKGFGGTYVSEADIAAIAAFLRVPAATVRQKYCVLSGSKPLLVQRDDGYCVFWEKGCTIHPVKPLMCRRWPFIPSLLVDIGNWQIMADSCPGMLKDADTTALIAHVTRIVEESRRPASDKQGKDHS